MYVCARGYRSKQKLEGRNDFPVQAPIPQRHARLLLIVVTLIMTKLNVGSHVTRTRTVQSQEKHDERMVAKRNSLGDSNSEGLFSISRPNVSRFPDGGGGGG